MDSQENQQREVSQRGRIGRGNWHLIAVRTWAAITEQCGAATAMMMNCFLHTLIGGIIKLWPAWNAAWNWEQGTGNRELATRQANGNGNGNRNGNGNAKGNGNGSYGEEAAALIEGRIC